MTATASAAPAPALVEALAAAVARRGDPWPAAQRAASALEVVRSDAGAAPGGGRRRGQADAAAAFAGTAVREVADRFDLDEAECRLLAVAAAAEHTGALHLLIGLLAGDDGPGRPTVALALELAGLPADAASAVRYAGPLAPMTRTRLVRCSGSDVLLSRRLVLPDRVAAQFAGHDLPAPELIALLCEPVPVDVEGVGTAVAALEAGTPLIWVHGPAGSAGGALAAAACRRLDVPCLIADLRRVPRGEPVEPAASALLLECGLTGAVAILAGAERVPVATYEQAVTPVIAVSSEPWQASWSAVLPTTIAAPRLSMAERATLWWPLLGGRPADREISALRLGPEQIVAVGRHARATAKLLGEDTVDLHRVQASARMLGRGHSVRNDPDGSVSLEDIVLPRHALGELRRLLDWARYRDEVVAMGSLHGKGGKGTGICALFSGPPGTGKTLAAHVIADSLAMDLFQVELSSVVDKYIGETEKNLETVFTDAESMNAVLFFDEADALFGSRSEVKDARDRYANQEIAYLLQRMEQFDGITVLASNLRGNIDPAFARRLHFIISFPEPDEPTRARLWEHHLAALGGTDDADPIDVAHLAHTAELSGGDIRNIVLSATYAAIAAGESVGMRHIGAAVRREYIKLGKRVPADS
ncbi:MAG: ATP-binding protein [Jatrophihabitans sp.]|nr:MAG: ATP-binding protein [Jatrophihabitans sp.]